MKATDKHTALTQERLKELLHYDPETGAFIWRASPRSGFLPGRVAGCAHPTGYLIIKLDGRGYYVHRLAWLYMTGEWPDDMLDHANMNKADNRWRNLRAATRAQNNANRSVSASKGSLKGAYYNANRGHKKWQALIRVDGRAISLGYYRTAEEANAAYCRAAIKHFGIYARSA